MKIRIKFRKYGPVRFIGHLDVMRYYQKALRRAGIDVTYSLGFSPHPVMSFASPLGVGLESNGEYVDIELNKWNGSDDLLKRLNEAGVFGLEAVSAKLLPETAGNAGNAMASVAAASYTVRFRESKGPQFDCSGAIPAFMGRESIMIQKETKKGMREVDLRPGIYRLSFHAEDGSLSMLVDASSAGNVKPGLLIDALFASNGEQLQKNALLITREELYTNIGSEEQPEFIPLDDIGVWIAPSGTEGGRS